MYCCGIWAGGLLVSLNCYFACFCSPLLNSLITGPNKIHCTDLSEPVELCWNTIFDARLDLSNLHIENNRF